MNHLFPPLLSAGIGEVIGSLVGLLMLLLWVINQIAEGKKAMGRPAGQRPVPPPAPAQQPAAQVGAKQPVAGGLRGEVEDFLRRAVQQPAGQPGQANRPVAAQRKAQPAPADRIEMLVDEQGRMIERRRPLEQRTPAASSGRRPATAKPVATNPPRRSIATPREPAAKRETVAEHVRQHIDSGSRALGQQASKLGQRIVQDDAEFDVQLKAKFDHGVGALASNVRVTDTPSQSPANTDTTSPAALLAAMLSNPDGVRQAVLMNEILRRPNERW